MNTGNKWLVATDLNKNRKGKSFVPPNPNEPESCYYHAKAFLSDLTNRSNPMFKK